VATVADVCDCLACCPAPPNTGKYVTPICSFIFHLDLRFDEGEFRVARSPIKTKLHIEPLIRVIPAAIKLYDYFVWFYTCAAAVLGFQTEFQHRTRIASLEWKVFFKQMLDWIDRVRPTEHAFQFFDEALKAQGARSRGFSGYFGYFHPFLGDRRSFIEDLRKLLRVPG
jgi:hypothetical protein